MVLLFTLVLAQPKGKTETAPQLPQISGITTPDPFPNGCVDCHKSNPERLSILLKGWTEKVEPKLLEKAQAAAPAGAKLAGKHPSTKSALSSMPKGCLACHSKTSQKVPSFARMLHTIHLTGGKENHYLIQFKGNCTPCHKLNAKTGEWTMPSAAEKYDN